MSRTWHRLLRPLPFTLVLALAAAGVRAEGPPPPLLTGSIEAGAYKSTENSYRWGNETGIKDDAWYPLVNLDLEGWAPWNSDQTWNFRFQGYNLGLDSPWLRLEGGEQGLFHLYVGWQEMPYYQWDTTSTVFYRGANFLSLPSNWVGAATTPGMTALPGDEENINISRFRRDLTAGGELILPDGFSLTTDYKHDERQGRLITGGVIGNTGGNPRTALLPAPVDYTTDDNDAVLHWTSDKAQFELGYQLSYFDDGNKALTWQNPYTAIAGWAPSAGYPTGYGSESLPPDNSFNQIHASGGYSLPWRTRIAGSASFAWYRQSESLMPYSVNPVLEASVTTPLPRNSAQASIDATTVGVHITSHPLPKLRVGASYRFVDNNNNTPRDVFVYIGGDSQTQPAPGSDHARINAPYSYRTEDARLDLGYEIYDRTELTAGYQYRNEKRSWTEVDYVDENAFRVGLQSHKLEWLDFRVDSTFSRRKNDNYFGAAPLAFGYTQQYLATLPPGDFENAPDMRKFLYADRDRARVQANVTVTPIDKLNFGLTGGYTYDQYPHSDLGLRWTQSWDVTVNGSWDPTDKVTTYAYYTFESLHSNQKGRSWSGTTPAQAFDVTRNWRETDFDDVDTIGVGAEWRLLSDRLSLQTNYAFSRAEDAIQLEAASALSGAPFPNLVTYLHDVSFQARYKIRENLSARFGYLFERYHQENWSYNHVGPATINEVVGLGQGNPNYSAHLFAFSIQYDLQ
jgi:MtrB/PioB family decaheme-associated outer membrane protein